MIKKILITICLIMLVSCKNKNEVENNILKIERDEDDLYITQWGLKNNGNFYEDESNLIVNFNVVEIKKSDFENKIYENLKIFDNIIKDKNGAYRIVAFKGIDTKWEEGYKIFKEKSKQKCIIAIIDTGIDINHEDLKDSIWENEKEIANNGIDDDKNGMVDDINGWNFIENNNQVYTDKQGDTHGTHIAGIIAAKHKNGGIKGIAYNKNIKIMPVKVMNNENKGNNKDIINGIKYAINNGASIINLSLGITEYDKEIDEIIKKHQNVLFIIAAGNSAQNLDNQSLFTAKINYNNVIKVGNMCFNGQMFETSNYSKKNVDIFAPGTYICSTIPENQYGLLTGTSMANGFVTATCAMMYSIYPNMPSDLYKKIINLSAEKVDDLKNKCASDGMLNINRTIMTTIEFNEKKGK